MLILIAGPYRSGTGDDPQKIAATVRLMESFALPIFVLGHTPVLGEWIVPPLAHMAGTTRLGDEVLNHIFHPVVERFLKKCDAVLRVGGKSAGADRMMEVAQQKGLQIFTKLEQI